MMVYFLWRKPKSLERAEADLHTNKHPNTWDQRLKSTKSLIADWVIFRCRADAINLLDTRLIILSRFFREDAER